MHTPCRALEEPSERRYSHTQEPRDSSGRFAGVEHDYLTLGPSYANSLGTFSSAK